MSEMQIFEKAEFGKVRVVEHEGQPWFVASDVAKSLGYADPSRAVVEHCKKQVKSTKLVNNQYGNSTPLNQSIIPESDVYRLVMRSNLPSAKKFQDWVVEEVLPSIRKFGGYMAPKPDDTPETILARAVLIAQDTIRRVEAERDEAIRTKSQIGGRREATAMASASAAVRKVTALENELGRGRDYKAVKGIPWFLGVFTDIPSAYSVAGRKLSEMSRRMGYEIKEIEDSRFGNVKAYHVDVIDAFRIALMTDRNMLWKYRRERAA